MYKPLTLVYPPGRQGKKKEQKDDSMRSTTQVYASVGISTGGPFPPPTLPEYIAFPKPYAVVSAHSAFSL